MTLADISAQFILRQGTQGRSFDKEASGDVGVPGIIATHRIVAAQRTLSGGTGEPAGHLIGIQFGAPGHVRNLGLQNTNMSTFPPRTVHAALQGHGGSTISSPTGRSN